MKTIKKLSAKEVLDLLPYDISIGELQDMLISDIAHVFVSEQDDIGDVLVEGAHFVPNEGGYIYTGMHILVPQTTNESLARAVTMIITAGESQATTKGVGGFDYEVQLHDWSSADWKVYGSNGEHILSGSGMKSLARWCDSVDRNLMVRFVRAYHPYGASIQKLSEVEIDHLFGFPGDPKQKPNFPK